MGPRTRADIGDSARRQHLAAAFWDRRRARFECQRGRSKEAAQDSKLRNLQSEDLCVVDRSVPPDIGKIEILTSFRNFLLKVSR